MGGDFSITRLIQERFPISRQTRGMRKFNKLIDDTNFFEIRYLMGNSYDLEKAA